MKKESAYVRLERSREFRLWVTQVGLPVVAGAIYINSNPELKNWASNKIENVKTKVKGLFNKNGSSS